MRGQQGHLYLSVRGRNKTQSSLSRKCGKAKTERRALRKLCVPGGWALNSSNGCCSSSHQGELCQWWRILLSHRAAWLLGPAPWDGVHGAMWDSAVRMPSGSGQGVGSRTPYLLDCCPPFFTHAQIKHLLMEHFEE